MYVSVNRKLKTGSLCYKEAREHPSGLTNEVYCLLEGRFVTYYTNHLYNGRVALLLLCEVEVYGKEQFRMVTSDDHCNCADALVFLSDDF